MGRILGCSLRFPASLCTQDCGFGGYSPCNWTTLYDMTSKLGWLLKCVWVNYMWTFKAKISFFCSHKHQKDSVCCWKPDVEELNNGNRRLTVTRKLRPPSCNHRIWILPTRMNLETDFHPQSLQMRTQSSQHHDFSLTMPWAEDTVTPLVDFRPTDLWTNTCELMK